MSIVLRSASLTDVGLVRERNEDACFAGRHVFAVADGLGGHSAGEVASRVALESIAKLDEAMWAGGELADALRKANRAVFDRSQEEAGLKGMGTTMTALAVDDRRARLGHVGDSRCYLIRSGTISQLSTDHTLVARMVAEGKLTPAQAETHPQRSILTRALGAERDVDVDEVEFDLAPGDRLVLCSDGLTSVMTDEEIRLLVGDGADLDEICRALIDEANARGGPDNITAVVVDVSGSAPPPRPLGTSGQAVLGERGRRIPTRILVWLAVLTAVLLGGTAGVRAWANRSFYVGVENERVAIYRGLPVEVAGVRLARVEEPTAVRASDVPSWLRARLDAGIRATSLDDARRIVDEQIEPNSSPPPSPRVAGPP